MTPDSSVSIFVQWQFWLAIVNLLGIFGLALFQKFAHDKIVGNDLHHIASDLKGIILKQDNTDKKLNTVAEDVAYLKGRSEIPLTKKRKVLSKKICVNS